MISQGLQLHQDGRFSEAEVVYRAILSESPENPVALHLLGLIYLQKGILDPAIELIAAAISYDRRQAVFHANLGVAYKKKGEHCFEQARRNRAESARAIKLGEAHFNKALKHLNSAVRLSPEFTDAHFNRASLLRGQGRYREALLAYKKVISLNRDAYEAYNDAGNIYLKMGDVKSARDFFLKGANCSRDGHKAFSNYLLSLNYDSSDKKFIFAEHQRWQSRYVGHDVMKFDDSRSTEPDRVLNIGYLSPDFHHHSVAYFALPLISAHDRNRFRIFCYSDSIRQDDMQQQLRQQSDMWRDISQNSDSDVAALIRDDTIDILIDLSGHTGGNRLMLFARKPAPLQISYIGYPNTTGLSSMDYRLTDHWADPGGDDYHTEKLIHLPSGFLCYSPPEIAGLYQQRELNRVKEGVVFGCFNILAKISDSSLAAWSELLKRTPGSKLIIKNVSMADPDARKRVLSRFKSHGIYRSRLELIGWTASREEHLSLYNRIDIALDTFPYNGTTTTCEALWMGVPVITLEGSMHAGRVGLSLLERVGLTEYVADSVDHYVDIAVELAGDMEKVDQLHISLRPTVLKKLCNKKQTVGEVEAAFRDVWVQWCMDYKGKERDSV